MKASSEADADLRKPEATPPAGTDEPSERRDSLSTFSSEGTGSQPDNGSTQSDPGWPWQTVAVTRESRYRGGHSVPAAIADDRATRDAISTLGTYVDAMATVQAVCTSIDKRLTQAEETLARTEGFVADRTLHELSTRIAARLTETEDAVRHIERVVASGPPEELFALQTLGANIDKRLAHVEGAVGRTEGLVADRTLHEVSAHIEARLTGTEDAVRRIEGLVASGPPEELFALQTLGANIDKRLAHVEEALGRTEGLVADRTVHEASAHIAARLTETEGAVRRIEGLVASGAVAELSARVEGRFAQIDDALRRIEAALDSKSGAPSIDRGAVAREAAVAVVPSRPPTPAFSSPSLAVRGLPAAERLVGLGAATVVLVGVLIFVAPARVPISVAAPPPPRAEQQPAAPVVEPEPLAQAPPVAPLPPASPSTRPATPEASTPVPRRRAAARTTADATAPPVTPVRFVGDLSITSTPPGARVFVNGRAVGVTPVVLLEQRAGSVAVQIVSEGFERWSASVQIPAGQVTNVVATLRASRPQ